ncbi:MAG: hypothetical protein Q9212_003332, partial [Teloschistes hypoglaucus]
MESKELDRKTFVKELYELDQPDTTTGDVDTLLASLRSNRKSRASTRRRTSLVSAKSHSTQRLGRTVSAPVPLALGSNAAPVEMIPDSQDRRAPINEPESTMFKRSGNPAYAERILQNDNSKTSGAKSSTTKRKRKRSQSLELLPEAQQTFQGLRFYFIPNDDVTPARKLRIRKARERGAYWVKEWIEGITHVIADKRLTYDDIIKFLKLSSMPFLYHVPGQPQKLAPEEAPIIESDSEQSLPLKPGKHAYVQPSQTPPRTEPLDDDEDGDSPATSMRRDYSSENNSSDDGTTKPARKKAPVGSKTWQKNFSCMSKNTSADKDSISDHPNARTISILQQMSDYYARTQDHWRTIAYRKAISALKRQPHKIASKEEALAIPGIGARLADKIEEIVYTDRLRRLENTSFDASDRALQLFLQIYGVGLAQASQWIQQGHRSFDDLVAKAKLTKNQKVGIDRFHDFNARIPRGEVERHAKIVRDAFAKEDPAIEVIVGGSYRRGAQESGDVDFIITKPACSLRTLQVIVFETVIPKLFAQNYLKCTLASASTSSSHSHHKYAEGGGGGGSKWHGAAALPSFSSLSTVGNARTLWRRIDFLLVPHEERGAALIYFTGNDIFNR